MHDQRDIASISIIHSSAGGALTSLSWFLIRAIGLEVYFLVQLAGHNETWTVLDQKDIARSLLHSSIGRGLT